MPRGLVSHAFATHAKIRNCTCSKKPCVCQTSFCQNGWIVSASRPSPMDRKSSALSLWRYTEPTAAAAVGKLALESYVGRHSKQIIACDVSPGGQAVVAASDSILKIWNLTLGEEQEHRVLRHGSVILDCAYLNADVVMSLSTEKVLLWMIQSGTLCKEIKAPQGEQFSCCAVFPIITHKKIIVIGRNRGQLYLVDWMSGSIRCTIQTGQKAPINAGVFSADGTKLALALDDNTLILWDVNIDEREPFTNLRLLHGHDAPVLCCDFSPNGQFLVSGSKDGNIIEWNLGAVAKPVIIGTHARAITGCSYLASGQQIVAESFEEAKIKVWPSSIVQTASLAPPAPNAPPTPLTPRTPAAARPATPPLYASQENPPSTGGSTRESPVKSANVRTSAAARARSPSSLSVHRGSPPAMLPTIAAASGAYDAVPISPTPQIRAVLIPLAESPGGDDLGPLSPFLPRPPAAAAQPSVGSASRSLNDAFDRAAIEISFQLARTIKTGARIDTCALSPNGYLVLTNAPPKFAKLWNITTGLPIRDMKNHEAAVTACAYSTEYIVTGSQDKTLRVRTSLKTHSFKGHQEPVSCCALSPDNKYLVSGSADGVLCIWDNSSISFFSEPRFTTLGRAQQNCQINDCTYSPDGHFIATVWNDACLIIWNVTDMRQPTFSMFERGEQHTAPINKCCYFPDGKHLVTAADDNTLKIWNTTSGECIFTMREHTAAVRSCAVSSDGKFIISASDDKKAKLWQIDDLTDGNIRIGCAANFEHDSAVTRCLFSPYAERDQAQYPGFRFILTTTVAGEIKFWDRYPLRPALPVFDSSSTTNFLTMFRPF